jgi:hypothetical protein
MQISGKMSIYDHYLTKRRDDVLEDRASIAGTKVIGKLDIYSTKNMERI